MLDQWKDRSSWFVYSVFYSWAIHLESGEESLDLLGEEPEDDAACWWFTFNNCSEKSSFICFSFLRIRLFSLLSLRLHRIVFLVCPHLFVGIFPVQCFWVWSTEQQSEHFGTDKKNHDMHQCGTLLWSYFPVSSLFSTVLSWENVPIRFYSSDIRKTRTIFNDLPINDNNRAPWLSS